MNPIEDWDACEELLQANKHNLTNTEKQQRYILEVHLMQSSCPVCHTKQNVFEAADGSKEVGEMYDGEYRCIGCGVELEHIVPLMSTRPWHWVRKYPPTDEQMAKLKEMHNGDSRV